MTNSNESVLLLWGHLAKRVVCASEIILETSQSSHDALLNFTPLSTRDGWGQAQSLYAAASAHSARANVLLVKFTANQLKEQKSD